jgi:putative aldouronate transport system permease protein
MEKIAARILWFVPSNSKKWMKNYQLYLFVLPALIYFIIFHYVPMYGVQIAFKDYMPFKGFLASPWVGFEHFESFFHSFEFKKVIINTLMLNFYELLFGFPLPILFALMINEIANKGFKKFTQTVVYAPHFISTVVLVGMIFVFLSPQTGLVNKVISLLGFDPVFFMGDQDWFRAVYILSNLWQNTGWNTIIYLAALSTISPELHESATIDGANKRQQIWHINLPGILPTAIILLILNVGHIMSLGFEKVYLMQTPLNFATSEVISTYVYKRGLLGAEFSFSTAVGLFNSVINFVVLIAVNRVARKMTETSLW